MRGTLIPFLQEMKYALRGLLRSPGFLFPVVITLALAIGGNAAIFSVVRGILLRPLPNREEDRLIYLRQSATGVGAENAFFSVPEIADMRPRLTTIESLAEFSTINFTAIGLGEPRQIRSGVVDGKYFEVVGLKPVLGRLILPSDDGPSAEGVAVLTHRFWLSAMRGDPEIVGKTIRLGSRSATIIGVVEPSVPYPTETELYSNIVTSPHHLSAAMTGQRTHRMTEVFGRVRPGVTVEQARNELIAVQGAMKAEFPESYDPKADYRINAVPLREQITAEARGILLVLLTASGLLLVIACANVANLILARVMRRQGELAVRAALGASASALRATLLAESAILAIGGALLGLAIAVPSVNLLALYAARFTVRAQDLTLDASLFWVAAALAIASAVLFAFVPRLPGQQSTASMAMITVANSRTATISGKLGQRVFAVAQIAACFVLLSGAGLLVRSLVALQSSAPGYQTENVLAVNVPINSFGKSDTEVRNFYQELRRRVSELPGVRGVAVGSVVPLRENFGFGADFLFHMEGAKVITEGEDPRAAFRSVSPGFFATLGIPLLDGREFTDNDRNGAARVVIVSKTLADTLYPGQQVVGRELRWTDPRMPFIGASTEPRVIVGVVGDIRDVSVSAAPAMAVYHPFDQEVGGGRLFVHAAGDPYALVQPVTRIVREMSTDQVVERAATLADIRADVLSPSRVNAFVISGFAGIALLIAVIGVAAMLAFSVSGRIREFGIRLALGAQPQNLLRGVLVEGAAIAFAGIAAGGLLGWALTRVGASLLSGLAATDITSSLMAAALLALAATIASAVPAMRAARVNVIEALRAE